MPVWGVLVVRLEQHPDCGDLNRWRRDLLTAFDPAGFVCAGPLEVVRDAGSGPVPLEDGSIWLDVGTTESCYEKGYERGDPAYFVRVAEWIEQHIDGSEVWYGNDCSDESISPFGAAEREALLAYYREVGHEPYYSQFRKSSGT